MKMVRKTSLLLKAGCVALAALSLSACASSGKTQATKPVAEAKTGVFGGLFGGKKATSGAAAEAGIGVNGYLWRASLDTIGFMPLVSADPWGGVIITDWYANPEKSDEQFKVTIYITDARLRADALSANVVKKVRDANGAWVDTAVNDQTKVDIENAILTRARELRLSDVRG